MTTAQPAAQKALPLPFVLTREQMVGYTHQYEGERFSDGRPRVPEAVLERMKAVTIEEAWAVLDEKGYHRNWDPATSASYGKTMIIGYNTPIVIGRAAAMPGDVVLGLREGVVFIPAHLALEVVERSELTRLKDAFGFQRPKAGIYTGGQIDAAWTAEISSDFHNWVQGKIDTLPPEQQEMLRNENRSNSTR